MKSAVIISVITIAGGLAYALWPKYGQDIPVTTEVGASGGAAMADVELPNALSQNAQIGERAYEVTCAACHGTHAAGQDAVAPPLIHRVYEPSYHGDESFQRAAALGVRAHHWSFGDMPPVADVTRGDVTFIIAYIRELQRANGID